MSHQTLESDTRPPLSRRDFTRGVALIAAASAVSQQACTQAKHTAPAPSPSPQLPPAAEAQAQAIFRKYGDRLSEEQKADVKRLVAEAQKPAEALRAFPLDNSNEPAMVFRVYRAERE